MHKFPSCSIGTNSEEAATWSSSNLVTKRRPVFKYKKEPVPSFLPKGHVERIELD